MHSHHEGEVWAIAPMSNERFFTAADDNKILLYDLAQRKCIARGFVQLDEQAQMEQAKEQEEEKGQQKMTRT